MTDEPSEGAPPVLYHYTSQRGLMGILTKGELWASDVRYLNDSKEYTYALELAETALEKKLETAQTDAERAVLATLIDRTKRAERSVDETVFAASLTAQGDLLSQWLSYCPGGGGYALGFDVERLAANAVESFFVLKPCEYDLSVQTAVIDGLLESTLQYFRKELQKSSEWNELAKDQGALARIMALARSWYGPFASKTSFWSDVTWHAALLKHQSFRAEGEWRLIPERPDQTALRGLAQLQKGEDFEIHREGGPLIPDFREGRGSLVPYVPVSIRGAEGKRPPVVEIVVGPTRYPDLALSALRRYAEKLGYEGVELKLTQATYRDM